MAPVKVYEKLLAEWIAASNKKVKFQQLLKSWIKAVDTKNAYRQLLNDWVETDKNLKNRFESLLKEWAESDDVSPYNAVMFDLKESKSEGDEYLKLLKDWSNSENTPKICPVKQWLEEWLAKDLSDREDKSDE